MRLWAVMALCAASGCAGEAWDPQHPTKAGPPPPAPIAPNTDENVPPRPTFSWKLPKGVDGAQLEIYGDKLCLRKLREVAVDGTSVTMPVDLLSGNYCWRTRGRAGGIAGTRESEPAHFVINNKVVIEGKQVDIILPREVESFGTELRALGDSAMQFFADELGRPLPDSRSRVYFYLALEQLREVQRRFRRTNHPDDNPGFTLLNLGSHILLSHTSSVMRAALVHELAHAFQLKRVLLYNEEPTWLQEGVCDELALRMIQPNRGTTLPTTGLFGGRTQTLREAIADKRLIPLADLFSASHSATAAQNEGSLLFYAESFSLVHFLDSSENPERQKRFRAFLRDISNMRGFLGVTRMMSRFHKDFGDTATLEREWLAWVEASDKTPATIPETAPPPAAPVAEKAAPPPARLESDGFLHRLSSRAHDATALHAAPVAAGSRIRSEVTLTPQSQGAEIFFGLVSDVDFYLAAFFRSGTVALYRYREGFSSGRLQRIADGALSDGHELLGHHEIAVDVGAPGATLLIDGKAIVTAPRERVPSGTWGVATYDDKATIVDGTVVPVP